MGVFSDHGIGLQGKQRIPPNSIVRDVMVTWMHEPGFLSPESKARTEHFEKHERGFGVEVVSPVAVPFLLAGWGIRKARQAKYQPASTCPLCLARGGDMTAFEEYVQKSRLRSLAILGEPKTGKPHEDMIRQGAESSLARATAWQQEHGRAD